MKKLTLLIIFCMTLVLQSFGQLNPVNNLEWNHWYICPHNFFRLTWDPPSTSQDTLIGYNVYRENQLYRFQTEAILNCEEFGGNCQDDFLWFNGIQSFYIHVTAVYNSSQLESAYVDSAYCFGYVIGIEKTKQSNMNLFPNPTNGKIKVDAQNIEKILIINQLGDVIQESKEKAEIDLSNLPKGIYLIKIITRKEEFVKKIILK